MPLMFPRCHLRVQRKFDIENNLAVVFMIAVIACPQSKFQEVQACKLDYTLITLCSYLSVPVAICAHAVSHGVTVRRIE